MLEYLKEIVYKANMDLKTYNLVNFTWGNVSAVDREKGMVAIKPTDVNFEILKPTDIVIVDLDGRIVEGCMKPSKDTPTHIELYKAFPSIGGIVHTHSIFATAFAQRGRPIFAYGTSHADYFYGDIPCTRNLVKAELEDYEKSTGKVIIETIGDRDPMEVPAVIVKSHGPFTWGKDAESAVRNAAVLENVAKMAYLTETLPETGVSKAGQFLLDSHYLRKNPGAKLNNIR